MKTKIIDKYLNYNFHDSTLESLNIRPSNKYDNEKATINIKVSDPNKKDINIIFHECANLSFNADFDTLKDNSGFGNTSHTEATDDIQYLTKVIQNAVDHINIEYEGLASPIDRKLENVTDYICFKILFFGGTFEVIAKQFEVIEG